MKNRIIDNIVAYLKSIEIYFKYRRFESSLIIEVKEKNKEDLLALLVKQGFNENSKHFMYKRVVAKERTGTLGMYCLEIKENK